MSIILIIIFQDVFKCHIGTEIFVIFFYKYVICFIKKFTNNKKDNVIIIYIYIKKHINF